MDGIKWRGKLGRRAKEDSRLRHFPFLGYSVILVPVDVAPYRNMARMMIGTFYGFEPDELIPLRARRLAMDGENVRTRWAMAVPKAAMDRRSRPARGHRKGSRKGARKGAQKPD